MSNKQLVIYAIVASIICAVVISILMWHKQAEAKYWAEKDAQLCTLDVVWCPGEGEPQPVYRD